MEDLFYSIGMQAFFYSFICLFKKKALGKKVIRILRLLSKIKHTYLMALKFPSPVRTLLWDFRRSRNALPFPPRPLPPPLPPLPSPSPLSDISFLCGFWGVGGGGEGNGGLLGGWGIHIVGLWWPFPRGRLLA